MGPVQKAYKPSVVLFKNLKTEEFEQEETERTEDGV
jgi:hypothetical protein